MFSGRRSLGEFQGEHVREGAARVPCRGHVRIFKATYLRASYGQGFRFPTIGERYIRTSVGQLHIYPNEELEPEFSVNVEGGIKQGFSRWAPSRVTLDAVVFQQDFDRFVEFTFSQWVPGTLDNLFGLGFKSREHGWSADNCRGVRD